MHLKEMDRAKKNDKIQSMISAEPSQWSIIVVSEIVNVNLLCFYFLFTVYRLNLL